MTRQGVGRFCCLWGAQSSPWGDFDYPFRYAGKKPFLQYAYIVDRDHSVQICDPVDIFHLVHDGCANVLYEASGLDVPRLHNGDFYSDGEHHTREVVRRRPVPTLRGVLLVPVSRLGTIVCHNLWGILYRSAVNTYPSRLPRQMFHEMILRLFVRV